MTGDNCPQLKLGRVQQHGERPGVIDVGADIRVEDHGDQLATSAGTGDWWYTDLTIRERASLRHYRKCGKANLLTSRTCPRLDAGTAH